MFNNIGRKIKTLAEACTCVGITISIIVGLLFLAEGEVIGIIIAIIGSLVSWISSFLFYGFGQLIENTDALANGKKINTSCKSEETKTARVAALEKWKNEGLISEEEYQEGIEMIKKEK